MKKTVSKCFSIFLYAISIYSVVMSILSSPVDGGIFNYFGIFFVVLTALTLFALWISCMVILYGAVKETFRAGAGIGNLFQVLIGKISKTS